MFSHHPEDTLPATLNLLPVSLRLPPPSLTPRPPVQERGGQGSERLVGNYRVLTKGSEEGVGERTGYKDRNVLQRDSPTISQIYIYRYTRKYVDEYALKIIIILIFITF